MTLLDQIQTGRCPAPPRMTIYGIEGIGKSSFGADAPNPIFISTEDGLGQIDCHSFPLATTFDQVMQSLRALYSEEHEYRTVVVDTLDWLERLIWAEVCREHTSRGARSAAVLIQDPDLKVSGQCQRSDHGLLIGRESLWA